MNIRALVAVVLCVSSSACHAYESIYVPPRGAACIDRSRAQFSLWSCAGPKGYAAEFMDEGNVAGFAIRTPREKSGSQTKFVWRGSGQVFGELLEWRMKPGRPVSALMRIWRRDHLENEIEELVLFKVHPDGFCRVASIDARRPRASFAIRDYSEKVDLLSCIPDEEGF
jgi:hypothetical protein